MITTVASELSAVEAHLAQAVRGDGLLGAAAAHLTSAPAAKRVRPRLVLALGTMAGVQRREPLLAAAAAVELVHTASLLHDDVVDLAQERRGQPSANAAFGNSAAVLAGDVVLARALSLLSFDPRAVATAIEVVAEMSIAAVRELEVRANIDLDENEPRVIAMGKTGALFGLCGRVAGLCAGSDDTARRFDGAGRALGVAFQIADDIGDIGDDLVEGTASVPLRLAARDGAVAAAIRALWATDRAASPRAGGAADVAARMVAESPALADARALVIGLVDEARALLSPWQGTVEHAEIMQFAAALAGAQAKPSLALDAAGRAA